MKKFYLTTTLPYVNANPHVGFALEIIHADIIARYKRLIGYEVFFNTGTDEHGLKIYNKAKEERKDVQKYVDEYAVKFDNLKKSLNLSYDAFIRTTDNYHLKAVEKFWNISLEKGDIYKKNYKIKYCVGCELEKTESDLKNGKCPEHPDRDLEIIEEENYFFRFSKYQDKLLKLYKENPEFVIPDFRFNEIKSFVKNGLKDFSISRLKEKMPWGVPVPGDNEHVIYVWFDALINYISTLGWGNEPKVSPFPSLCSSSRKDLSKDETLIGNFEKFWPGIQFAGKDNLRQQSAMWQAMLMSVGLPTSKQIIIHGFILTEAGEKISKSSSNAGGITDPFYYVNEYGTDAVRYYLARHIHPFEDTFFSVEKFKETYNANLANGLGNLVSRITKMFVNYDVIVDFSDVKNLWNYSNKQDFEEYKKYLDNFEYNKALDLIWGKIGKLDRKIAETQPFKLIKTESEKAKQIVAELVVELYEIAEFLKPVLPETSEKIIKILENKQIPEPLFLRKE